MSNRKDLILSPRIDSRTLASLEEWAAPEDRSQGSVVRRLIRQAVEAGGVQKCLATAGGGDQEGSGDG